MKNVTGNVDDFKLWCHMCFSKINLAWVPSAICSLDGHRRDPSEKHAWVKNPASIPKAVHSSDSCVNHFLQPPVDFQGNRRYVPSMTTLIRTLSWLKDYWYVPLLLVLGLGASLLWRRFGGGGADPMDKVHAELKAIDAAREVRQVRLEQGLESAQAAVQVKYAGKIMALDSVEADRVSQLQNDPEAMARAIERLTR